MRNSVKGALSAAAAVVLLAGGAGTMAYWTAADQVGGTPLDAGRMALLTDTTNRGCGDWQLRGDGGALSTYAPGQPLVPGDRLELSCGYTIDAEGSNLEATVRVGTPDFSGADSDFGGHLDATVGALTVDGEPATSFTAADDGSALGVSVQVRWDGADTGHMDAQSVLDDLTLTAQQVAP